MSLGFTAVRGPSGTAWPHKTLGQEGYGESSTIKNQAHEGITQEGISSISSKISCYRNERSAIRVNAARLG